MSLFVLADTHLSLSADKPMDVFGARWKDHAKKIEKNWNAVITDADTIVIPGDISWAMNLEQASKDLLFLASLPGRKILARGNHDYYWTSVSKMRAMFSAHGYDNVDFLQNNAFVCENFVICGSRGWYSSPEDAPRGADYDKVMARENLRLEMSLSAAKELAASSAQPKELIAFFHFPPVFGDFVLRETVELLKRYGVRRAYYGHIHGLYNIPSGRIYDGIEFSIVSADYLNFVPLLIREKNFVEY